MTKTIEFDFPLPITRILYEAEQPILFITKNKQEQEMLAYLSYEEKNCQYFLISLINENTIKELEENNIGIRETLLLSCVWLIKSDFDSKKHDVRSVPNDEINSLMLPRKNIKLKIS